MILIHCPYCDERRPEIEFFYAGEAHYVRPSAQEQNDISDEGWARYLFMRNNIRGGINMDAICFLMPFEIR